MIICPACGYDLRAMSGDRCPECGHSINRASLAGTQIPWTFRKGIGRWRAYWKTVALALFEPRRLAMEVAHPLTTLDAQEISARHCDHRAVAVAGMMLWRYFDSFPPLTFARGRPPGSLSVWLLDAVGLLCHGCLWLFLFCIRRW